jgi:integrase
LKIKKEEVEITPLSKDELNAIRQKDFRIKRLNQVRDCFVFASYTAMAYADLANISRDDIREQSGVHYIQKQRVKTGVQYTIPLNDIAMEILQRYDYHLPVLTNQRYNSYLKEIADICGIEKNLTSHLARHTAATLMLNSGISIDVVAKILGHRNTQMTAHYAKMLDKTIILTKIEF